MVTFKRKDDYSPKVLDEARRLMEAGILVVPNKDGMKGYSNGLVIIDKLTENSFNIIGKSINSYKDNHTEKGDGLYELLEQISGVRTREEKKNCFFDNIEKFIEIVGRGMPRDKERMSSQRIAMNHMTFEDDRYSVCGWETALGKGDIEVPKDDDETKYKKPEIDLVMVHPQKREMLFVEYKCKGTSMTGAKQNIAQHGMDYMQILHSENIPKIRDELLNAYNVYRRMKDMPELAKDTYREYKVRVGFLFVDEVTKNGEIISEITDKDYQKGMKLLNDRTQDLSDDLVYIRAKKIEDVRFDEWKAVKDSNLKVTI